MGMTTDTIKFSTWSNKESAPSFHFLISRAMM